MSVFLSIVGINYNCKETSKICSSSYFNGEKFDYGDTLAINIVFLDSFHHLQGLPLLGNVH